MAKRRKRKGTTLADVERRLRVELRSILRQYDDLRRPLDRFERHPNRSDGEPRFFVAFDRSERREITGLRARMNKLVLPDERILESVLQFAASVWHLKDPLNQLAKARDVAVDVESVVENSEDLRVCADLANAKKHGRCENRSGLNPRLGLLFDSPDVDGVGLVHFDTSNNGVVELFYEGSTKEKALLVTKPVPIPFTVEVLTGDGRSSKGDAVTLIYDAFRRWLPIIRTLGILETDDPECKALRSRLEADAA